MTKNEILELVSVEPDKFKNLPAKFKKDKEIVLAAVKQDGRALEYADESLKKDREIALVAEKNKIDWGS